MKKEDIIAQLVALKIFKAAADAENLTVPQLTLMLKGANADAEAEEAKAAFENSLSEVNDSLAESERLRSENAEKLSEANTKCDSLAGMVEERDTLISELSEKLAKAEGKVAATDNTIQRGGKIFTMTVPKARFEGQVVSLEILRENPKTLDKMILAKSPVIVEVTPEKS